MALRRKKEKSEEKPLPRALWMGTISFGLVSIPIRLVTAIKDKQIHFHRVSPDGRCRLRQKLWCPESGKEYDFGEAARGYEVAPHQYVLVDDEEFKALKPQSGKAIDIIEFVKLSEVDPIYFDRAYYVVPDGKAVKPYELLRQVMQEEKKVAVAKLIMHDKEHLIIIRGDAEILRLQTLHYNDEIVSSDDLIMSRGVSITNQEKKLASDLVGALTKHFDAEDFYDEYRKKMGELLEAKSRGEVIEVADEKPVASQGKVVDLMGRLKASLKKKSAGREEEGEKLLRKHRTKARKRA